MSSMPEPWPAVIVGGGAAGLSAACALSRHGRVSVLVLDENAQPGPRQRRVIEAACPGFCFHQPKNIRWSGACRVIGIFDDKRIFFEDGQNRIRQVRARAVLLATGARERFVPFKGWNLPGVISLGYARRLAEEGGLIPGQLTVIAGSGPLLYPSAASVIGLRGRVGAVVDANSLKAKLSWIGSALMQRANLPEAIRCAWKIAFSKTRLYSRRILVEAFGNNTLRGVVSARIDAAGRVVSGTAMRHEADAAAVGNGFAPNIELARQAECPLKYAEDQGGWVVRTGEGLGAGRPGVFAAGEITGIGGVQKALIEGRLAALGMLRHLEMISGIQYRKASCGLARMLRRAEGVSKCIRELSRIPDAWVDWIDDDTLVCRCEDVRMGRIRKAVREGLSSQVLLKKALRVGMGYCQGRICGPILEDIVSALTRTGPRCLDLLTVRPPVSPVSVGALARAMEPISADDIDRGFNVPFRGNS